MESLKSGSAIITWQRYIDGRNSEFKMKVETRLCSTRTQDLGETDGLNISKKDTTKNKTINAAMNQAEAPSSCRDPPTLQIPSDKNRKRDDTFSQG
ncbi:unnamed protein product [Nezara viridula]|uniref:Uncharacterized protein n=1 Tax=Nezara viridula TaxID=85310 RepID=A0A9P0HBJ8_NEZVI|nr:unnamed protein product [Nezara viridula]